MLVIGQPWSTLGSRGVDDVPQIDRLLPRTVEGRAVRDPKVVAPKASGPVALDVERESVFAQRRVLLCERGVDRSAEIHRLTGEVELSLGNASRAQTSLDRALEIARRQGAKTLELRATATLARLLRGQGKGPEARRLLEAAYHSIPPGFDTADLSEAKGLFEDLTSYERCSRTRCRTRNPRDGLAI